MNRRKAFSFLPILLLTVLSLAACSGPFKQCTTCGTGNATVSLTLVSDTPPASPSLLSYKVTVLSVTLTPATGTAVTFTPNPAPVIELMRLQSDAAFLGTLLKVPVGSYSSITVSLGSPQITFLNNTGATITNASSASGSCTVKAICTISPNATGLPKATFAFTLSSNAKVGLGIDFNLSNSITVTGGTMTVTFTPATAGVNVLSAFNLPRMNANLGTNQLELIEDFTGVVSISGSNVTITSATRGTLTANTSNSFVDPSPDGSICPTTSSSSFASCAAAGQIASVDAFLNSDGTISLKEFEPLNATQQDFIEGTVVAINPSLQTQFTIVTTDKIKAATNSVITTLNTGDVVTVNIPALKQGFFVDSKGLALTTFASYNAFVGQTTTSAIFPGQTVALHLTAFTAANGTTLAVATADTVILRWTRLRANVFSRTSASINIDTLPSYFGFTSSTQEVVQAFFPGALGTDHVTNLDGVANDTSGLTVGQPVGLRVLYFQNAGNTANPAFFAAKIRQP